MKQRIIFFVLSSVVLHNNAAQLTPQQEWKKRREEKARQAAAQVVMRQSPVQTQGPRPPALLRQGFEGQAQPRPSGVQPQQRGPQQGASVTGGIPVAPPLAPLPPIGLSPRERAEIQQRRALEQKRYATEYAFEHEKFESERKFERAGWALPKSGIMVLPKGAAQNVGGQEKFVSYPTQGLVILLDDDECETLVKTGTPNFGAVTMQTWSALLQQVPMLVSTSLLKNIFTSPHGNPPMNLKNAPLKEQKLGANDLVRRSFKPDEWMIRQVSDALILLLPKKMVKGTGSAVPTRITERELTLGLKIDHMKPLVVKTFFALLATYQVPSTSDYFIDALSKVFVTCPEYERYNAQAQQPQWTFYLSGHGELGKNIAELSFADFRKMLNFFEDQPVCREIRVQCLIINSCYATGTNATLAYKNIGDQEEKSYSFPIIMNTSVDAAAVSSAKLNFFDAEVTKITSLSFQNFFYIIHSNAYRDFPHDVMDILSPISALLESRHDINIAASNYPHVRPAFKKYIVSLFPGIEIGNVMIASHTNPPRPLDVFKLLKERRVAWDWMYLVLHAEVPKDASVATQYITFPIVLERYGTWRPTLMPIILSAAPGAKVTFHRIVQLTTDYDFNTLITNIITPKYSTRKIFWIENLEARGAFYKNVIINITQGTGELFYTDPSRKEWKSSISDRDVELNRKVASPGYSKKYDNIFVTRTVPDEAEDPQVLLRKALETGNVAQAQQAIARGTNPREELEGIPILHAIAMLKELGERGADIAALLIKTVEQKEGVKGVQDYVEQVYDGRTPLMLAAFIGNTPVIRVLLANKALINATDQNGMNALTFGIVGGQEEIVLLLLNAGADYNKSLAFARDMAQNGPEESKETFKRMATLIEQWQAKQKERSGKTAPPQIPAAPQPSARPQAPTAVAQPPQQPQPAAASRPIVMQPQPPVQVPALLRQGSEGQAGQVDVAVLASSIKDVYQKIQKKQLNQFLRMRLVPAMTAFVDSLMSGDEKALAARITDLQGIDKDFGSIMQQLQPLLQLQPVHERRKKLRTLGKLLRGVAK